MHIIKRYNSHLIISNKKKQTPKQINLDEILIIRNKEKQKQKAVINSNTSELINY